MVSFKKTGPGYDTNENGASNLNIYFASSRIVSLSVGKIASRLICKKKKKNTWPRKPGKVSLCREGTRLSYMLVENRTSTEKHVLRLRCNRLELNRENGGCVVQLL